MKSFQSHMNEKAGINGTIGLYKKDGQGGYTASDDDKDHDCKEEHPGVSHKKWVVAAAKASDDVNEKKYVDLVDKDLDNDGDEDHVDRHLHKKRKASRKRSKEVDEGRITDTIKKVVGKLSDADGQVAAAKRKRAQGPAPKPGSRLSHADRQLDAVKRGGVEEGLLTTPIVKAARAAKAGAKHSAKAAAKAGVSAFRRGVGDELVKKGQNWHRKDSEARRKSALKKAAKKTGTMTSTPKIQDEEVDEALDPKTRSSAGIRAQFDRQGKIYDDPQAHHIKKIKHSLSKGRKEIAGKRLDNLELRNIRGKIKPPSKSQTKTVAGLRKTVGEEYEMMGEGVSYTMDPKEYKRGGWDAKLKEYQKLMKKYGDSPASKIPPKEYTKISMLGNQLRKAKIPIVGEEVDYLDEAMYDPFNDKPIKASEKRPFTTQEKEAMKKFNLAQKLKKAKKKTVGEEYEMMGEVVSVDGRTKGYRDAISRIAARHKVVADRMPAPEPDEPDSNNNNNADGVDSVEEANSSYKMGIKAGKNPGFRAADSKDTELNDFLKNVSSMIGRGAKPDEVRASIHKILPLMKKRGVKVTPQQKAALKKLGIKEEVEMIDELSTKTLASYIKKRSSQRDHAGWLRPVRRERNKRKGIERAVDKLAKKSDDARADHQWRPGIDESQVGRFSWDKYRGTSKEDGGRDPSTPPVLRQKEKSTRRGDKNVRAKLAKVLVNLKKKGIRSEEFEMMVDELSPAQKEKRETSRERAGSKEHQVKSSGLFGLKKTHVKRAIRPKAGAAKSERRAHSKAVGKGIDPDNRDPNYVKGHLKPDADVSLKNQKNRRNIASKMRQIKRLGSDVETGKQGLKKSNRREEVEMVDEGGLGGRTQSKIEKTGTHSSNLNYVTRSKKQGWSDRDRSSAPEKKRASKEARRAGKKETEVDESKSVVDEIWRTPRDKYVKGAGGRGLADKETQKDQTGAQNVITKYKKRAANAKQWKKDNGKTSLGIEETANVGDKNAPVTSQDMSYLSDFHKDVYGTRPTGTRTYKNIKTVGDYQAAIESLSKTAKDQQKQVKQDRINQKKEKATEKKIQKKRTFGPKGGTQKTTLTPAFTKALAKSRSRR